MITANAVLLSDKNLDLSQHGIDRVTTEEAGSYLARSNPSVLGVHCCPDNYHGIMSLISREMRKNTRKCFIVFHDDLTARQLIEINNLIHPVFSLPFSIGEEGIQDVYQKCFDRYYQLEQSQKLIEMVNEKNDELKRLMAELEQKVEERQGQLEKSKQRNMIAQKELDILQKTLVHIYGASSISKIERGIADALKDEFQIAWVKIVRPSQSNLSEKGKGLKFHKATLKSGHQDFGHLLFFKKKDLKFEQKEKRFLNQIADAVFLSIQRSYQYQRSQGLKKQWETTFDAISDPICLTDEDYNILRINAGFLKKTNSDDFNKHIGQKCYRSLFGRNSVCEGCCRGQVFQIRNPSQNKQSEVFDVYSNNLGQSSQAVYFQMYRDITQDLNLQRQVIESAKMAELGTISSSVAHELNNPIGGMLNFIQLMKMDMTGQEDFFSDLIEIEKGVIKCKNIVKNLLGFSRKSFNMDIADVDLNEVIEQAIKITELKTRSIGIRIQYQRPEKEVIMQGRFNLLTHAVLNILQNSQESLIEKRKRDRDSGFVGLIDISLVDSGRDIQILIGDNGDGLDESLESRIFDPLYTTKDPEVNSGLGLTLALQIVEEHRGGITVSTGKDKKLWFRIQFFKSEVQSG